MPVPCGVDNQIQEARSEGFNRERVLRECIAAGSAGFRNVIIIMSCEVDADHVHLYMEIPPQISVGSAVRILKSLSARYTFKIFPYLKKKFWSGELWDDGYFCRTVREGVTAGIVRRYLENHADKGLEPAQGELFPKEKV